MTDKELRRLSRAELLEMLLVQVEENEKLKLQIEEMQTQLDNRQIMIDKAGSIAEAAMQLNGVFQAAEAAAAQYLENIQRLSGEGGGQHEEKQDSGDADCLSIEGRTETGEI
ncbi:DNA repair protein [Roseburia hominis]